MKLLVFSIQFLVFSIVLNAATPLPISKSYWKDPSFLKSFNASYLINARIEPSVSTSERGLLVSIQPLMASGKRKEALAKLTSSALMKSSAAINYNAGNIQFEQGDLKAATASYLKSIRLFPNFRRAHRNLGFAYARVADWEKALASLETAIRLGDQDGATYGQLAYGRLHNDQYASALQAYRLAQITQPNNLDWKAGIANCLQHLQRNQEALILLDEVIAARPNEAAYLLLQSSIYLAVDRPDDAITNLDFVRRLGTLDAENHLLLASLHLRGGSNRLARPVMMAALEMENKPPLAAVLNLLEFATQTQSWKLARDFSQSIQKTFPKDTHPKHQRLTALIDIDSGGNPARGAEVLEKLTKENPLDAAALILLARYRSTQKRYEESEMLLQQAGRVEGAEYESHIELAKLCVMMSRYRAAVKQLDQALKLKSTDAIITYRKALLNLVEASE